MSESGLRLDGHTSVEVSTCHECRTESTLVRSFVLDAEGPYAIGLSSLHRHDGAEAWIDVIFGTFDEHDMADDRTTFGCRVGRVAGGEHPAATAVGAAVPYADGPVFGRKLSRDEALTHPRIADFWRVVDFLLVCEPVVRHHVYGHRRGGGTGRRRWGRR